MTTSADFRSLKSGELRLFLEKLTEAELTDELVGQLISTYEASKDLYVRNMCLKLLYNRNTPALRDFFIKACKRERYLDMKIKCIRGAAMFLEEEEINLLMRNFIETLKQRPEHTPYNYQEYESLLGKNALPYLVGKYGYDAFRTALSITHENYNGMPDAFKGHYTVDEKGEIILLRPPEETSRMLNEFFASRRTK